MAVRWQLPAADPSIALRPYEERLATLESPRHRTMLQTLIDHVRTVLLCDIDGVMRTMSAEPEFATWSAKGDLGRKGSDAVRAGYAGAFAKPGGPITNQVNSIERFVIDDRTIALELVETRIWPAAKAKEQGYAVPEEEGCYAVRRRCAVLIPYDDQGLIQGEINYGFGWPADPQDFERVEEAELSPEYLDWLRNAGRDEE